MSGVASRNPFALLGDADDVAAASTPAAPKPAATPVAPVKAKSTSAPTPARTNNRSGGRGGARGGAAAPRGDAEGAAASEQKDVRAGSAKAGRGESRGRGGRGRGERGGRGRAFDRHSQTGKEDTEKKIAQGWGAQDGETELAAEENGKADAEVEVADGAATPAANGTASERPAPIPEEEDNTKTLDEYLAEQTAKRAQLGVAKAEGREINQSAWDKLQATKVDKTKAEEDYFAAKEKASKGPRARKEKQFVEIDTRFETPASTRGGSERGGRGGARGGSERGARGGRGRGRGEGRGSARGGRGGSSASPQVNLADQSAFPSLA